MRRFLSDIHKRLTIYSEVDIVASRKKDWIGRRSYFLFNDLKGKKVAYYADQIIGTFCTLLSDIIMHILSIPYCIIRGLSRVIKGHEGKRCSKHNDRFTNDVVDNLFVYPVLHMISALIAVIMMPIFMIYKIISTIVYPFTKQENLYIQPEVNDYKNWMIAFQISY